MGFKKLNTSTSYKQPAHANALSPTLSTACDSPQGALIVKQKVTEAMQVESLDQEEAALAIGLTRTQHVVTGAASMSKQILA